MSYNITGLEGKVKLIVVDPKQVKQTVLDQKVDFLIHGVVALDRLLHRLGPADDDIT